jgi:hypothetical protein
MEESSFETRKNPYGAIIRKTFRCLKLATCLTACKFLYFLGQKNNRFRLFICYFNQSLNLLLTITKKARFPLAMVVVMMTTVAGEQLMVVEVLAAVAAAAAAIESILLIIF